MADDHEKQSLQIDAKVFEIAANQAARSGMAIDDLVTEALRLQVQRDQLETGAQNSEDKPQPGTKSYFAFISYSHSDRKIAADLHRRLERFPVPRALIGRATQFGKVPRRIRPIFRDQDEFPASADLGRSIRKALRAAHTLIVVCSPRSAASAWVGEEIRYFKQLGRGAHIFCLLIDGSPFALDREGEAPAALHSALLENFDKNGHRLPGEAPEPLAIDFRASGFGTAVVKIAAGVLNVSYEDLHQRVRRQKRRKFTALTLLISAVMVMVSWLFVEGLREKQNKRAQELAVIARQQLYNENPVAGIALALHAVAIGPDDNEIVQENARVLSSRGQIATFGKDIESIVSSPGGTRLVVDREDAFGEVRSGIDGTLQYVLPGQLRSSRYYAEGEGYFLMEYERSDAELRSADTGELVARVKSPVSYIIFGPKHLFAENSSGYPGELLRLSDGGLVRFADDARPSVVTFGTEQSDLMVISFSTKHEPQLRRMSDDARVTLQRQAAKIELSPEADASRLLITYTDGIVELIRSTNLSLVRQFDDIGAPQAFWSRGARLFSSRGKDGVKELIDMTDGSSVATGSRIHRSRDPSRSLVAVVSKDDVSWYSATAGTKLGRITGRFSGVKFSRDIPPSHIALEGANGWQLHRLADGSLVIDLPDVAEVSLDKDYLVTSDDRYRHIRHDTKREVRKLDDGSLSFTLNQGTDRVTFVSRNHALVESEEGSRHYYWLPSGRAAKVPSRRNIEFNAALGPDLAYHMIRYSEGRTEIRAGLAGPAIAWIEGKTANPPDITFLPETAPSHILVSAPDIPSEVYTLIPTAVEPQPDEGTSRVTLPSTVAHVDLLPIDNNFYLLFRYTNGNTELWQGLNDMQQLTSLRTNLEKFLYSESLDRLVLLYANGAADILDLEWLKRATVPGITDRELFELACKGPLSRMDPDALEVFLQGDKWMGCHYPN